MVSVNTGTAQQSKLRAHLSLARISNTPTVVSNVLAGVVMATALKMEWLVVALCVAIALFYTAGMYLNDILDLEIDREQRPDRPLPSGVVSLSTAWGITIALFVIGLALVMPAGMPAFIAAVALVICIAVYDAWHKGNPIGPLFMGGTRVLVYVVAYLAFSTNWSWEATLWCGAMLVYVAGLTSISKTEHGPAGIRYWPIVSLFVPVVLALAREINIGTVVISLGLIAWAIYSLTFVLRPERRSIGRAIAQLIAGISLVDALVLATHEAWWGVGIALVAFGATVYLQRWIRGT